MQTLSFWHFSVSKSLQIAEKIIKINLKNLQCIFIYELWTIYINKTISLRCELSGITRPFSCREENWIREELTLRALSEQWLILACFESQGYVKESILLEREYIMPGEVKKLNLLEIHKWRVQAQCYIPKFPSFIVFQAGTRWGERDGKAVLEFAGDLFGLRELSRPAQLWERKKIHLYCASGT